MFAVLLVAVQRLLELRYSRRNERRLRAKGAVERGREHYPAMVAIHALWLASTLVEGLLRGPGPPAWWPAPLALFFVVQPLRYWAISSLGENWNVRVLVVPGGEARPKRPLPLRAAPQLRRRGGRSAYVAPHLRSLDYGARFLGPERHLPLRPHQDGEPRAQRALKLR